MGKQFDLLLTGGMVVTGEGIRRADVGVRGEVIAAVEPNLPRETAPENEVVDVTGRYVFPGIIDAHVHPVYVDSVEGCSRVAAYGGTTTLLHFAYARTGDSLVQKVEEMLEDGVAHSRLDFGLHGAMFEAPKQVPEIPRVMELGVRTFKFFLTYLKQGWYTDDYQLIKGMDMLAERGGMAMVHCENGGAIDYLEDKYLTPPLSPPASGGGWGRAFSASRPPALEEEAAFRALNCPLYIVHNTTARVLPHIRRAQAEGQRVFAETCPQYLTLTQEIVEERGALAKIGPPIRTDDDQAALWEALRDGTLQTVASDHAPKRKDIHGDFLEQPFGDLRRGRQPGTHQRATVGAGVVRKSGAHLWAVPEEGHHCRRLRCGHGGVRPDPRVHYPRGEPAHQRRVHAVRRTHRFGLGGDVFPARAPCPVARGDRG